MPPKTATKRKCSKCKDSHFPPTGKNCGKESMDKESMDTNSKIQAMVNLMERMTERLEAIENARDTNISNHQHDINAPENSPAAAAKARHGIQQLAIGPATETDTSSDEDFTLISKSKARRKKNLKVKLDWPQNYIFTFKGKVHFDTLTLAQFAQGFAQVIMHALPDKRTTLLKYFANLMEDASRYSWELVRGYHFIVYTMVEEGRLTLNDADELRNLRRHHIWNVPNGMIPTKPAKPLAYTQPAFTSNSTSNPCPAFQTDNCHERGSHDGLEHICAYCMRVTRRPLDHAEAVCRRKLADSQPRVN